MMSDDEPNSSERGGISLEYTGQKTLIHVSCHECVEVDKMLIVDEPRESNRVQGVTERYSSIMERHAGETGHHGQLGVTEGSENDLVDIARALASENPQPPTEGTGSIH